MDDAVGVCAGVPVFNEFGIASNDEPWITKHWRRARDSHTTVLDTPRRASVAHREVSHFPSMHFILLAHPAPRLQVVGVHDLVL